MNNPHNGGTLDLIGLDGANPLAFLAALGTFRVLSTVCPDRDISMSWGVKEGAWRPRLSGTPQMGKDEAINELVESCRYGLCHQRRTEAKNFEEIAGSAPKEDERRKAICRWLETAFPHLTLADDLTLTKKEFAQFASHASKEASIHDRATADFAAAFGSDAFGENEKIQDTSLRTMAGAGHQHFLGFMRNIVLATTAEHLEKALFRSWKYDDPVENLTLRWDPMDDVRYALRWRNPSGDPVRKKQGSVLGGNRLAIEGMPLLPTIPLRSYLATTGFRGRKSSNTFWTWPIWRAPLSLNSARSLLAMEAIQKDEGQMDRRELEAIGVVEVYRSQRITIGKVRNFSPAVAVG